MPLRTQQSVLRGQIFKSVPASEEVYYAMIGTLHMTSKVLYIVV